MKKNEKKKKEEETKKIQIYINYTLSMGVHSTMIEKKLKTF